VTRRQIALVSYAAGLTIVGGNLVVDAIGRRFFDCDPDPYFPVYCTAQKWAYLGIIVACWFVATYLVARREAIGPFACVFIGLMLGFGIVVWVVLATFIIGSLPGEEPYGFWGVALSGVIIAVPIGLLTAAVGYPMQVFVVARRKRLGRPAAERPARTTGQIVMNGGGLVVVSVLILATLATAGVFMYARGVPDTGESMVMVVVSKVDIPARTDLDQMIKDDQFRAIQVPDSVVVNGAVTSIDQLSHRRTRVAILAGEQIPVARIKGV
jgi:hypothetical protein